jgi:hypothetical protein
VFLSPVTLQDISVLREPSERVPLSERLAFEAGQVLVQDGALQSFDISPVGPNLFFQAQVFLKDPEYSDTVRVRVLEDSGVRSLDFRCDECGTSQRTRKTCQHQWAAFIYLWQGLALEKDEIFDTKVGKFSSELKDTLQTSEIHNTDNKPSTFVGVQLDSVSLYLEEPPALGGAPLKSSLSMSFALYKPEEVGKDKEMLTPLMWNMPEVFRRKLTAYSEFYHNEVNEQMRMAGMVSYNFSNGMQISARDILRHPLYKTVPRDLLPQSRTNETPFARWPLTQQREGQFISQALRELEEIMQTMLANIVTQARRGKLELFLQTKSAPGLAMKVNSVEFDPVNEVDWRVEFQQKEELLCEMQLVSFRKKPLTFFDSYALQPEDGMILVHPWMREWKSLQEALNKIFENAELSTTRDGMPVFDIEGELEAKAMLRYLRTRNIPVKITGVSRTLDAGKSLIEIHLTEGGSFFIKHAARVMGMKDLQRKGWTAKSLIFFQTLSEGLPYLLNMEAKDIATRARGKRDWDLKLLKHLGILQYISLELLSVHFEGALTDGKVVEKKDIFNSLHERIQSLLVTGTGVVLSRDLALTELCSKAVLAYFEDFIAKTLKNISATESFYSEEGEVILEGIVEREFRLIFEMLKKMAISTGGEAFKKSRTTFLSRIWDGDIEKDPHLREGLFHFPAVDKGDNRMHQTLESTQALIPLGYKIYYKEQVLQELEEDEFHVDFVLQTDADQKYFNWFELNPRFFLHGEELDPKKLAGFGRAGVIEYDGKLFLVPQQQMPSLRRLENFWMKLQKGKQEGANKRKGAEVYQLPRHQILELLALRASGVGIRGDAEWKRLCEFYDSLGNSTRDLKLPNTIKGELKPYQKVGVQWLQDLYNLRLGALLADDMGLGKTLQTLSFLEDLRTKGEMGPVLIVVPSSLIYNWQSEAEKFTPSLPLAIFSSRERDRIGKQVQLQEDIVVIATYGLLLENGDFLNQYKWKVLIFDEAQNLKNITTKRTSAARSLTAQFKICLTGTPMENHYGEFYSLVDILVPGSLGKIEDFRRQFVNTEMVTREEMDDLKLKIKPLLLRRTKKEILDQLPEKQETKVSIAFEERQKDIYRDIAMSYNQRVQETFNASGEASVQLQMLTALLRLRQACSDPASLPNVRYDRVPPKLEALLDSVQEIVESGESALVFTQFLQTLEHSVKILKEAGVNVFALHGGIPSKQRQKILADFNNAEGGAVLVMTLKTGGVGLNLTKASYVFHLEPWWNPSVENQATDRAHRLGQSKAVQVFRYIMHESLEEKIEVLKDRKGRKFQTLFSTAENNSAADIESQSGALSKEDFDFLLGIK